MATEQQQPEDKLLAIRFPSRPDRLKPVRHAVSEAAYKVGCSNETVRDIVIAVDEACQNVIRHAYHGSEDGEIVLDMVRDDSKIVILLRDYADPVDVAKIKPRDLDDIRPGGLGTHFIREVMDGVEFSTPPEGGGNLLTMTKRIS